MRTMGDRARSRHEAAMFSRTAPAVGPILQRGTGSGLIATQGEPQSGADFAHPQRTQLSNSLPQSVLGDCDRVMQVDCARRSHAVFFIQDHLGWDSANGGCNGCNRDGREIRNGAVPSQHHHRPLLVRRSELIKTDIPSSYSDGQAASASQPTD